MAKNPQRYRHRIEPNVSEPIGDPPHWLSEGAKAAWRDMAPRLPWLNRSHRAITVIAAILSAKLAEGSLGVPGMQLLRVTLGQMGATPADFRRVNWSQPDEEEEDDLADEFFSH